MIGFYAHHHGSGHLHRCRTIMAALAERYDTEVALLSTHPGADVVLAEDAGAPDTPDTADLGAGGTLHYAPLGHEGYSARMAQIAGWVATHRPRAFYVDVSVEVAALVRLLGVPVVTLAMPGERPDPAHQLGYRQAAAVIAAWPTWVPLPPHLREHGARVHRVGGISRFSGAGRPPSSPPGTDIVVLAGQGGTDWPAEDSPEWDAVRAVLPGHDLVFLGGRRVVADPLPYLAAAHVVVAAAGQNSVADLAVAEARALILPQERPFDEQGATARLLDAASLAVVAPEFPAPEAWPGLVESANSLDSRWIRWQTSGAALRAAEVIGKVAGL